MKMADMPIYIVRIPPTITTCMVYTYFV